MIIAKPGHYALGTAVRDLVRNGIDLSETENMTTGPKLWGKYARMFDYMEMPRRTWYPLMYKEKTKVTDAIKQTWRDAGSFGVHHWNASWI